MILWQIVYVFGKQPCNKRDDVQQIDTFPLIHFPYFVTLHCLC